MRKLHLSSNLAAAAINMSKKGAKSNKKSKNDANTTAVQATPPGPIATDKSGNISIKIHAKPGAKQNAITDITDDGIGIQIAAPPIDGEANTELIKYLSVVLKIRKSDLNLDRGSKSREKTVLVDKTSSLSVDRIKELLEHEKGANNQ